MQSPAAIEVKLETVENRYFEVNLRITRLEYFKVAYKLISRSMSAFKATQAHVFKSGISYATKNLIILTTYYEQRQELGETSYLERHKFLGIGFHI